MTSPWRDTVTALAGPEGDLSEWVGPEWGGDVLVQVGVPGALFRIPGPTSEDAWRTVAHNLGHMRVLQALEESDWTDVDEFIDEASFVVARDPAGRVWGIGVGSEDYDLVGWLDDWAAIDGRPEWVAYVEPIETRNWELLRSAVAQRGRPIRRA
jgi:hypothetical protein